MKDHNNICPGCGAGNGWIERNPALHEQNCGGVGKSIWERKGIPMTETPTLPTHCGCCGAVLAGGLTKHATDCVFTTENLLKGFKYVKCTDGRDAAGNVMENQITEVKLTLTAGRWMIEVTKEFIPAHGGGSQVFRRYGGPQIHEALRLAAEMVTLTPSDNDPPDSHDYDSDGNPRRIGSNP